MRARMACGALALVLSCAGAIAQEHDPELIEAMKLNFICLTNDGGVTRRAIEAGRAAEVLDATIALLNDTEYMDNSGCRYDHVANRLEHIIGPWATNYVRLEAGRSLAPKRGTPAWMGPDDPPGKLGRDSYTPLPYRVFLHQHSISDRDRIPRYESGAWRGRGSPVFSSQCALLTALLYRLEGNQAEAQELFDLGMGKLTNALADPEVMADQWGLLRARLLRGDAYALWGDPEAALADYNKAMEMLPDSPWPYYCRACLYDDLKRPDDAREDRSKVRAMILKSIDDRVVEQ